MGKFNYKEILWQTTLRNLFISESQRSFAYMLFLVFICFLATYLFGTSLRDRTVDSNYLPVNQMYHPYDVKKVGFKQPSLTKDEASNWTLEAIEACFNFSPKEIKTEMADCITEYFTDKTGKQFLEELHNVGIPAQVKDDVLVTWFKASSSPQLIDEGVKNGRYQWEFSIPGELMVESKLDTKKISWDINVLVRRVSVLGNKMPIRLIRVHPK